MESHIYDKLYDFQQDTHVTGAPHMGAGKKGLRHVISTKGKVDWNLYSRPGLTDDLLAYAMEDVIHLHRLPAINPNTDFETVQIGPWVIPLNGDMKVANVLSET